MSWLDKPIDGLLLDIFGVLYDSGETSDVPIDGSIEAVRKLREAGIPFRMCSNTSTRSTTSVATTLRELGFDVRQEEIFTPIPCARRFLIDNGLRPYIIVDPEVVSEFADIDQSNPNCVLLGDATYAFTYQRLNAAFTILLQQPGARLISLGMGKYYKEVEGMLLDCGPFAKALEYASGVGIEVIGKPAPDYFKMALSDLKLEPEKVVMIGDDIESDVGAPRRVD